MAGMNTLPIWPWFLGLTAMLLVGCSGAGGDPADGSSGDEVCDNGVDDDGDGHFDCDDSDCAGLLDCPLEICWDGVDNDQDQMTDCADVDCASNAPGCNGGCYFHENDFAELCSNGLDDDCDGQIDQDDTDCSG